jgi:hypothetical protein
MCHPFTAPSGQMHTQPSETRPPPQPSTLKVEPSEFSCTIVQVGNSLLGVPRVKLGGVPQNWDWHPVSCYEVLECWPHGEDSNL